jgi:hypothetical protein
MELYETQFDDAIRPMMLSNCVKMPDVGCGEKHLPNNKQQARRRSKQELA